MNKEWNLFNSLVIDEYFYFIFKLVYDEKDLMFNEEFYWLRIFIVKWFGFDMSWIL